MRRSRVAGGPFLGLALLLVAGTFTACGDDGPDTCIFSENPDGSTTMTCPDGSKVRLPRIDEEQPKGGIRGTATLFGREAHAGIRVEVIGQEIATETDESGGFVLENVPAGFHEIELDAAGYEPEERKKLLVLPGAYAVEDAELKIGRRILDGREWQLVPSPRGDVFLARREDLYLVDPLTLHIERIAREIRQAVFSPDGTKIVIVAGNEVPRLELYEVDRRSKTEIARDVVDWRLTPNGDSLVYERRPEGRPSLEVWHHPSRRRSAVTRDVLRWRMSDDGGALVAAAQTGSAFSLIAWDLAASGGTGLGDVFFSGFDSLPSFGPDGRSFLYFDRFGDPLFWHGRQHQVIPLESGLSSFQYGPDGDQLLYESEGALIHRDLRTGSRFEIATSIVGAILSPDGQGVAYYRPLGNGSDYELVTWDTETRASIVRAVVTHPTGLQFDPSGRYLFFLDVAGTLRVWSSTGIRTVSTAAQAIPLFHPAGDSFLYHEGLELLWSPLDGSESFSLGNGVGGYPAAWDPAGRQLFFVTGGGPSAPSAYGDGWLFHRDERRVERVGTGTYLATADFVEDGSLLHLRRFDRASLRGELVRGGVVVGGAVPDGYRYTPNADRVLFRTDALPVREPNVVALWDLPRNGCYHVGTPREEPSPCDEAGGLTPVDAGVTDQAVGADWLAWVSQPQVDQDRSGVYVSHYPRDLPPPPEPEEPDEEEEGEAEAPSILLPNENGNDE